MVGRELGHYEIVELLGAGGMGEVYRARDTRLHRDVAIKVLPVRLLGDEQTRARFEREARLLASLNHPHIAAIHGLEQDGVVHFLVLEYVEGLDLEKRLRQGPMSIEETIVVARQIAEGLASAHRQGVIHRDLKPSNVASKSDGTVKILDFGLAKALDPMEFAGSVSASQSPTVLGGTTGANVILGTAAYMSPEQARGAAVDARADVWAYGCVLFECLTGRRLFEGSTVSDTLAAVLRDPVAFDRLPTRTPPALQRLIRRCLDRELDHRLHGFTDVGIELDDAERELREGVVETHAAPRSGGRAVQWVGWGVAAVLAAALAWSARPESPAISSAPVNRFEIAVDSLDVSAVAPPAISPDGRRIVYAAGGLLWVRELDALDPTPLLGTEGARGPFWAPDGERLGFQRGRQLLRTSVSAGHPTVVTETSEVQGPAGNAAWTDDDRIVFCSGDGNIYVVEAAGGRAETLLAVDPTQDDDFHTIGLLPGARGVLFVSHRLTGGPRLEVFADGRRRELFELRNLGSIGFPVWDPSGHVLIYREDDSPGIWALPFSLDEMRVTGEPIAVTNEGTVPSVAVDGTLVHIRGTPNGDYRIVRVRADGTLEGTALEMGIHLDDASYAPSGRKIVYTLSESSNSILVRDLARDTKTLVDVGTELLSPFWFDETHVGVLDADSVRIVLYDLERGAVPRTLLRMPEGHAFGRVQSAPSVAAGWLAFTAQAVETRADVWIAPVDDPASARTLLSAPIDEREPQISPDGSMLAWTSVGSQGMEIFVARLDADGRLLPRRWQVSSLGGESSRWSRDGRHLYYVAEDRIVEVSVERDGDDIELSRPRPLLDIAAVRVDPSHGYATCPDPGGFIMTQIGGSPTADRAIIVVQNWVAGLDRR